MGEEAAGQRGPGRPRALERREAILRAAAALFGGQGYGATTLGQIAAEVGLVQSALYRHFPGKAEILVELTARSQRRLEERLAEALSRTAGPRAAFEAVVVDAMRQTQAEGDVAAWLREAWHSLEPALQHQLLTLMSGPSERWSELVGAAAPGLDRRHARALVTAIGQVIASSDRAIDPRWYVRIIVGMLDSGVKPPPAEPDGPAGELAAPGRRGARGVGAAARGSEAGTGASPGRRRRGPVARRGSGPSR